MFRKFLPALALILVACSFAHAQTCQTYNLSGAFIIPTQNYPDKFEVLLLSRMGEQEIGHTNVDLTNRFTMRGLIQDEYDVVVRLEGFKEMRERVSIERPQQFTDCTVHEIFWLMPADSVVIVDERLRGYPKDAIDEFALAIKADANMHYGEVVSHLEKVVKLAADWFDAHCELGAAYENVHRNSDAEKQYRTALELKPDSFRALMSLGRLLVVIADEMVQDPAKRDVAKPIFTEAREKLSAAFTRDPMSAMASYMLGSVDFRLTSYRDAEIELKRALELDPDMYPARITLINVYIQQMQWENALENIDSFLLENPRSPHRQEVMATRMSVVQRLKTAR